MLLIGNITKKPCIYKITSPSGKIYIGQTQQFYIRYKTYCRKQCKNQKLLYGSIIKYGVENHVIEIIEETTFDQIDILEIKYIEQYKSNRNKYPSNLGLNLCDGGSTMRGYKQTDEHKRKIGLANKGRKHSLLYKENCSKNAIGNSSHLGFPHSEETKLKISKSKEGQASGGKNPAARKVIDTLTLVIYDTVKEASKSKNIPLATLSRYLRGITTNKSNLIYLDDYNKLETIYNKNINETR